MKLLFAGTGAADYPWKTSDSAERGSCSTLLDGHILIDAGETSLKNLRKCKIPLCDITHLLVTHSHWDHFNPSRISEIAGSSGKLEVYASKEALERLEGNIIRHPLHRGDTFEIGKLKITVLPSNHLLDDPEEETFHYLIESDGKRLLYALDGGWMNSYERKLLGKAPLDMIVWDATCGNTLNDWRFAEHNDLAMIRNMISSMLGAGLVRPDTVHIFDHTAMTLWPHEEKEKVSLASEYGGILAFDGMTAEL